MVTIISTNKTGSYRLLKRATYSAALQAYLYQTVAEKRNIVLIYDLQAKKAIYKAPSYHEHYQNLRNKFAYRKQPVHSARIE